MVYKLGVMGGTFDPIHIGHLASASEAMGALNLDEVVFVPALPSHKSKPLTLAEHRFEMVKLAVAQNPKFSVSRVDLDRGRPTFTVDTLTDLKAARGPEVELYFITGADIVSNLPSWDRSDELFELANFVGVSRSGHTLSLDGLPEGKVTSVEIPALAMSSTEIRARLKEDRPIWYWLPVPVIDYIGEHNLYETNWL